MVKKEGGGTAAARKAATSQVPRTVQRSQQQQQSQGQEPLSQQQRGATSSQQRSHPKGSSSQRQAQNDASSSQRIPSSSQVNGDDGLGSQLEGISYEETAKLCAEVMRYMLFRSHKQPGVPVKREELAHLVTKNYKQRSLTSYVLQMARKNLLSIFGLELKELQRMKSAKRGRGQAAPPGDVKEYVLISTVPSELRRKYIERSDTAVNSAFALMVIGIIQFTSDKVSEEELWRHLRRLGVKKEDEQHPEFGDIQQALETLVKQRYIQKEKLTGNEGDWTTYGLAERALDLTLKNNLSNFVSKIARRDFGAGPSQVDDP